jgi:riboflavin kinase/FMN adenylyltransferase
VYAGWAERLPTGARRPAAINIGTNPTFTQGQPISVEAHILDVDEDLYGAEVRLGFVARLRDEQRFANVDELVAQIRRDVEAARALVREP